MEKNALTKAAKIVGLVVGSLSVTSAIGMAYPKLRGLPEMGDLQMVEEAAARERLIIRERIEVVESKNDILNGKVDCVLLGVDYERCPAVRREKVGINP